MKVNRNRIRRADFVIKTVSGEKRELHSIKALVHTLIAIEYRQKRHKDEWMLSSWLRYVVPISPNTLHDALKDLEDIGLIERQEIPVVTVNSPLRLTKKGHLAVEKLKFFLRVIGASVVYDDKLL